MSITSVPVKLLYDAVGTRVTVELATGDSYAGELVSVDDNMCVELKDAELTDRKGRKTAKPCVFLRGANVVLFVLADALEMAAALARAAAESNGSAESSARDARRNGAKAKRSRE